MNQKKQHEIAQAFINLHLQLQFDVVGSSDLASIYNNLMNGLYGEVMYNVNDGTFEIEISRYNCASGYSHVEIFSWEDDDKAAEREKALAKEE